METKEYIKELKKFTSEKGISIYDYYYVYVEAIKSNDHFELPDFELRNPFLTAHDIKLLLQCKEDRIAEYYAYAMNKIVQYHDVLSKDDIKDVLNDLFDNNLSRDNIEELIDEELNKRISRKDIHDVIDSKLEPETKVVLTSINRDMANHLDGFVVIREEKTGKAILYHHDSKEKVLSGKQEYKNNQLNADTGFYVNIEEYVERLLDIIMAVYPTMESISFVKDGETKSLNEVLEEVFIILRDSKAIRFGKELKGKEINTYEDLLNIPTTKEEYQGKKLQTGMYVRRDILTDLFDQYKVKISYTEDKEKSVLK